MSSLVDLKRVAGRRWVAYLDSIKSAVQKIISMVPNMPKGRCIWIVINQDRYFLIVHFRNTILRMSSFEISSTRRRTQISIWYSNSPNTPTQLPRNYQNSLHMNITWASSKVWPLDPSKTIESYHATSTINRIPNYPIVPNLTTPFVVV